MTGRTLVRYLLGQEGITAIITTPLVLHVIPPFPCLKLLRTIPANNSCYVIYTYIRNMVNKVDSVFPER
jgi:hypothetical protein